MSAFDAFGNVEESPRSTGMWITGEDIARIQDGRGLLLCVQIGTVWITQAGSIKDVFVEAGGSFLIDRNGPTLVSVGGDEMEAAITLLPSARIAPLFSMHLATCFLRLLNGVACFLDMRRGIRRKLQSPTQVAARCAPLHDADLKPLPDTGSQQGSHFASFGRNAHMGSARALNPMWFDIAAT